jgi:hypothetical protein
VSATDPLVIFFLKITCVFCERINTCVCDLDGGGRGGGDKEGCFCGGGGQGVVGVEEFFGFSLSNNLHSFFLLPQLEGKQAASAPRGGELKFLRHQEEEETSSLRESFFGTQTQREREMRIGLLGEKLRRSTARGGGGEFNLRESFHTKKRRRRSRAQLEGNLPHQERGGELTLRESSFPFFGVRGL